MLSVPPATATSTRPAWISSTAMAMVCSPEEQKRLMVAAGTAGGSPARRLAMRATFMPCSPSGMAQPRSTSSTSEGTRPLARATASRMTMAPSSSGRTVRNDPLRPLPMAVRTPLTITASVIWLSLSIAQRFPGLERVRDPLERLRLPHQAQEHLALELEQVLLADRVLLVDVPAAQNVSELARHVDIVFARVAGLAVEVQQDAELGESG